MAWSSSGDSPGTYTGFTVRWQKLQVMPLSKSFGNRSEPSVAFSTRPSIHAPGAWHLKQVSPAPATSCSAMETAARKIGSRTALACSEPCQRPGRVLEVLTEAWHETQLEKLKISSLSELEGVPLPLKS